MTCLISKPSLFPGLEVRAQQDTETRKERRFGATACKLKERGLAVQPECSPLGRVGSLRELTQEIRALASRQQILKGDQCQIFVP